jgi:hypothetical protein
VISGGSCDGVVLLHGIARTSRSLNRIESALQGSQFATLNLDYASRRKPPVDYDLGIVVGIGTIDPISSFLILPRPNDGRVSVRRTRLEGMIDHTIVKASHPGLLRHPAAIEQIISFLCKGRFAAA